MLKKTLIILFVLTHLLNAKAQTTPWIHSGATWYYKSTSSYVNGNEKIQYTNDTIILGKICQILKINRDNYTVSPPIALISSSVGYQYTYNSGDTIFYLTPIGFKVLYNFGSIVNQTWDLGVNYNFSDCYSSIVKVDSLSSISFSGNPHRVLYTSDSANSSVGISGKIIEHIGSMEYLFPTGRDCDTSSVVEWFNYSFSCFSDSLESYSVVPSSECQNPFHVGIEQYNNKDEISFFPNPSSEKITLSFSQEQNYKISLYSILGVKLLALESIKSKTIELDLQPFAQNIYFVAVEDESGQRIVKKIIKK